MPVPFQGRSLTNVAVAQVAPASLDLASAPGAGLRIHVVSIVLIANGAGTLKFQENAVTDLTGPISLAANGGMVVIADGVNPILSTLTPNLKLNLVTATSFVNGWIRYFIDA